MKFFIDTANIEEIRNAKKLGMVNGVTTNPSLMAKEANDWRDVAATICKEVEGPVSLEVIAQDAENMIREAKDLVGFGPNVVVKIPMTMEGIKAVHELSAMDIPTNVTLIFSPLQALIAAKAGADYVSPFVGRLDDVGHEGMELVSQILTIYDNYMFDTEVIVASVRGATHVLESAMLGAQIATIPFKVINQLAAHPLTDKGLKTFLADWEKKK
ncbi:fructose-6-phosphate aldolase [Desulfoplanes sp.]